MANLQTVTREFGAWMAAAAGACPGRLGILLRRWHFRRRGGRIGADAYIAPGVSVSGWRNIEVGDGVVISRGCIIEAEDGRLVAGNRCALNFNVIVVANLGSIVLGNDVIIGMATVLRAANHGTSLSPDVPFRDQPHDSGTITVEDDVWIGANATILPNVRIGAHSIVAAGAVVTRDVPPRSVVAGVPARVVGRPGAGPAPGQGEDE